ncbi:MAG: inositol 2-dehydrogenase [Defluviitaleaceae bacterium]|nr:inositol 2-dehydrogenase [Defluviitaleaceae bacterium]
MKKVRIGSVGLGRLGLLHAQNIASRIPGATLTALCDLDEARLEETAKNLGVQRTFTDFAQMSAWDGIDAVAIVSPSPMHTSHIRIAMEHGKHVFCEKPLGITLEQCKDAEHVVTAHPELIFFLGFMRRFDPSYAYAKAKLDAGEIGRVVLFRSYSQDPDSQIEGSIAYAPHSGGQFLDMAVHDIDLARWFIGSEPRQVWAIGGCYAYPQFAQYNDGDNVSCLMKFEDDAMAFLLAGRTAHHGYNVETEIIGTKSTLRIGSVPQKNFVEILDGYGVRKECSQSFHERFETAFLHEMREFVTCISEGRRPEVSVFDGTRVLEIANQCKTSFETGNLVSCK